MTSRGDKLAQADDYLEPEGADFAFRSWVNEKTSRPTQTEKSKRGGDEENLSRPVTTINCETSATSADNWEFFGEVESKYSQMDSMTYELSGGASGSGLVTLGDFTSRVDGPFGGNWRLPVSPLAVGVTNLWVRGKNLKEKWGDRAFKSFTRLASAVAPMVFDEFDIPGVLGPWWTPRNQVKPAYQGGAPSDAPGGTQVVEAGLLKNLLPAKVGTSQDGGVWQTIDNNFDCYVELRVLESGSGGTNGTSGFMEIYDTFTPYYLVLEYAYNQGSGEYDLYTHTREAGGGNLIANNTIGPLGVTLDTVWLRIRYRSGDPAPTLWTSINDGGSWQSQPVGPNDLTLLDFSGLRLGINGQNNGAGDTAEINFDFLRDGSGI